MSSDLAICAQGLGKVYPIFEKPSDRLRQMFLRGRRKLYREFWALRDLDLDVRRGETVGIVGRNGSGKSTLLQLICGVLSSTSGKLQINGRVAALLELGSGFNPEFTGRENVYLNGALLGLTVGQVDDRFDAIAAFADIGDFMNQPVRMYSSGMYVRLAFAVAASVDADILVVDEALAVGDELFQRKCFARLHSFQRSGGTVLVVSHSAPIVTELCDRALLLERGQRVVLGAAGEVVKQYQRLLYAPEDRYAEVLAQAAALDSRSGIASVALDLYRGSPNKGDIESVDRHGSRIDQEALAPIFDPSLVPASTIAYPEVGVRIETVELIDEGGKRVNTFSRMQRFGITYHVKFFESKHTVHCGAHVRSVTGQVLAGQRSPDPGEDLGRVAAGCLLVLTFWFDLRLLPGVYFVGCGVWSEGGAQCDHRLIDVSAFRVLSVEGPPGFGLIDGRWKDAELVVTEAKQPPGAGGI
jgi:lipopolysaccharide transport system ATP-binding protein